MNKRPNTPYDRFVSVYQPIAGWKAVEYWWNPEGFWEPWQTGDDAYATREEAVVAATIWAECEQVQLVL